MEDFLWTLVMFLSIVGIVGLPGNILIILVYARKRQRRSYEVFILALAVTDLIVCLLIPVTIYHWYVQFDQESGILCRLMIAVSFIPVNNSCFLTSAIAVDRYLAICRPFRRWMTVRRAKLTALLCLIVAVIVVTPVAATFDVVFVDGDGNGTCTPSRDTPVWMAILIFTLHFAFSLSALAVSVVSYGKVYRAIRKQARVRPGDVAASAAPAERNSPNLSLRQMMSQNPMSASPGEPVPTVASVSSNRGLPVPTPQPASTSQQNCVLAGPNHHPTGEGRQQVALPAPEFQRSTTRMLAVSSAMFLSTWMLTLAMFFVLYIPYGTRIGHLQPFKNSEIGGAFLFLFANIFYLNNAINPFIYGFTNRRFRKDCATTVSALRCQCL